MGLSVLVVPEFSCDDVQLGREITLLSAQINAGNYRLLKLIAEFDIRGAWRCGGTVRSCAHWLAAQCGMTIGAAREKVRVARRLGVLPEVESAFSTGDLSYSKVRAITRVATVQNEGFMVMMAENASASHLEKLVSKYQPVEDAELAELGLGENSRGEHAGEHGTSTIEAASLHLNDDGSNKDGSVGSGGLGTQGASGCGSPPDAADEDERREQSRELYWFQDKDGMWIIHAKLPPEQGQLVMKALEAFARPLQEERQDDWKAKQKAQLQAVAKEISRRHRAAEFASNNAGRTCGAATNNGESKCVGLEAKGPGGALGLTEHADTEGEVSAFGAPVQVERSHEETSTELGQGQGVHEEISAEFRRAYPAHGNISAELRHTRQAQEQLTAEMLELERVTEKISAETFSQFMNHVRADAFAAMAEHFLATSANFPQFRGLKGAERCQVVLHVDINTLREQRSGVCCTHGKAHFEDKPWLSPQTARRLSCDASLVTVLEDDAGNVLNVGRRSRIVPAAMRRALMERDGVCRFPGCHESRYVDAHHIKHWAEGGETSLENLVTLCRFHHRQLHRGCFDIQSSEAGPVWSKSD